MIFSSELVYALDNAGYNQVEMIAWDTASEDDRPRRDGDNCRGEKLPEPLFWYICEYIGQVEIGRFCIIISVAYDEYIGRPERGAGANFFLPVGQWIFRVGKDEAI